MSKLVISKPSDLKDVRTCMITLVALLLSLISYSQYSSQPDHYRLVFYNVENFFDPYEDSSTMYNEFTPQGERHWTMDRYKKKRLQLYKVLTAIGEGEPFAIAGFAEIENYRVLEDLITKTPMENLGYDIIHFDSPDDRGIDVGMIYHEEMFKPVIANNIPVIHDKDTTFKTRDILYVKGLLGHDTLHLFFSHWPSRYGGLLETKALRLMASRVLHEQIDSICNVINTPSILVMGDFNDNPEDESIQLLTDDAPCRLQKLIFSFGHKQVKGTLKYKGRWERFDQAMVSAGMYGGTTLLTVGGNAVRVFSPEYLLTEDERYGGVKPKRTYEGYRYTAGFSDHLPIFVDLYPTVQQ